MVKLNARHTFQIFSLFFCILKLMLFVLTIFLKRVLLSIALSPESIGGNKAKSSFAW